jgi:hypothetical protein
MGISINAELRAEQHILSEQVRLIYKMLPYGLLATLAGLVMLAIALWETVPQTTLLAWLAIIISIGLVRFVLYLRYISLSPPSRKRPVMGKNVHYRPGKRKRHRGRRGDRSPARMVKGSGLPQGPGALLPFPL